MPFNRPAVTGSEQAYLEEVFRRGKFAGGGSFNERCDTWLAKHLGAPSVLTTTSCSHALEMAALMCRLEPGDEVILPSFAFPTTASAFVRCGASLVFVDVEPGTMNINPAEVAGAITPKTRVIVALHYAGVAARMHELDELAERNGLTLVEDAAQAIFSKYRGGLCGTFGAFGCLSFHETKNLQCGEGGALVVNNPGDVDDAEIILEKGTDRRKFRRNEISKYKWCEIGSSYVPGELSSAFLLSQLENGHEIIRDRLESWNAYRESLRPLSDAGVIEIADIPTDCEHNGHIFWIKTRDEDERTALIDFLNGRSIKSVFHYVPLHSSPAGLKYGRFSGKDAVTTRDARRLLRLPLFYRFSEVARVADAIEDFYRGV
ncbi:MAG: dTDP-4-amino-4,6-dideoxygalactose transaminase [bacterium]|nr:dTDP-4-amino-4,6-dideoxygalactose transaminase [bacterium]